MSILETVGLFCVCVLVATSAIIIIFGFILVLNEMINKVKSSIHTFKYLKDYQQWLDNNKKS